MKKFPFWVFPSTFLIFVVGIFVWLGVTGNFPWDFKISKKPHSFLENQAPKNIKQSPNNQNKKPLDFYSSTLLSQEEKEIFNQENTPTKEVFQKSSLNSHQKQSKDTEKQKALFLFQEGVRFFNTGHYKEAALKLEEFLSLPYQEDHKTKAQVYLAYACLFLGEHHNKENLLQKSQKLFLALYKEVPAKNPLTPQIVLGIARTSRVLENYPDGLEVILKENLLLASESLKKHFYLEIGYWYFYLHKLDLALPYFQKSGLPLAHRHFYEILLQKEGTALYLITLFDRNMIPMHYERDFKNTIQKKVLTEAQQYYKKQKKEEAFFLLKKLLTQFPHDPITEEANFYLGELYAKELQFQKALYFYDQVLLNQFPDYDAASLFRKGLIYNQWGNAKEALKNFNLIRNQFVSSAYYQPALDWIREIEKRQKEVQKTAPPEEIFFKDEPQKEEKTKKNNFSTPSHHEKEKEKDLEELFLKEEIPLEDFY